MYILRSAQPRWYLDDRVLRARRQRWNMFVGHYGVSFAMQPAGRRVPLWVWFIAVQWLDVVWSILVVFGVEELRIVPGFTQANALDLYYMPFTHGLPGSILLSLIFGGIVALFTAGNSVKTIMLVSAASFSHWVLDLIVHTPDLPLYGVVVRSSRRLGLPPIEPRNPKTHTGL